MSNDSHGLDEGKTAYSSGDYVKAFRLLMPFAEKGIPEAQCMIGSMFHLGLGVKANGIEAVKWYSKAGEQGYAVAYNNLGCIYTTGMPDVAADTDRAKKCYRKATEHGFDMIPKDWYEPLR